MAVKDLLSVEEACTCCWYSGLLMSVIMLIIVLAWSIIFNIPYRCGGVGVGV